MAASTKNLNPVIVYLPDDLLAELKFQAKTLDRPMSYVAREFIAEALAWRKTTVRQRRKGKRPT